MSRGDLPVSAYLKPISTEQEVFEIHERLTTIAAMCNTKSVSDRLKSENSASADHNYQSPVNISTVYNIISALANKQDDHHEHTVAILIIVCLFIGIIIVIVAVVCIKKFFNKRVHRAARQVALQA